MIRHKQHISDYANNLRDEFAREVPRLARGLGIDKALKNAFTPPGTSAAKKQQKQFKQVAGGAMDLYKGYAPWLKDMQPMMLQAYENLFNLGTQNNSNAMVDAMRRQALMSSLMANRSAMRMYGNSSLAQGMGINAMNKGMDASNAYMGQQYDPATLMNRMAQGLSAMQTPLQNLQSLAGIIYQQPQVQVGKGPLDYILPLAEKYVKKQTGL